MSRLPFDHGWSRREVLTAGLGLACSPLLAAAEFSDIVYPGPESQLDSRNDFYWVLLGAALKRTAERFGPYRLRPSDMQMNGRRIMHELERGTIQIAARATNPALEQQYLPIRIPLDKGMLGYRVFLIRREMQQKLDQVKTLEALRGFSIGQAETWIDVSILRSAGFNVITGATYEGLFGMLDARRFDLLCRSVIEAPVELDERRNLLPDLAIEKQVLLYYPLPRYFFVRRTAQGELLARRVETGLNLMLADGSFDKIFKNYLDPIEQRLQLTKRRLFRIPNPELTPETPLDRKELWYNPLA
ncbi:type 2 periplasmic-binding domain-containing protein [Parachitinimonas caeni]|uniref:Amino acid ABC transporter substrate-binding protein n=1 Tax=Parachitinimonas caeni TaxID=3031301 RepID=A0ABT7E3F4_9NEIS|nr:hypothetical protein [Parachitinimonas caeni]MDK2126846.1 hypothetical protein [Parachitinimonas caeni]